MIRSSLALALALYCYTANAEMVVRHVDPAGRIQIESPMEVRMTFPVAAPATWGQRDWMPAADDLGKYVCEDVTFSEVKFRANAPKDGKVLFFVSLKMQNGTSHDKIVNGRFQLVDGDTLIGGMGVVSNAEIEEGRAIVREANFVISEDVARQNPRAQLRMILTVSDN